MLDRGARGGRYTFMADVQTLCSVHLRSLVQGMAKLGRSVQPTARSRTLTIREGRDIVAKTDRRPDAERIAVTSWMYSSLQAGMFEGAVKDIIEEYVHRPRNP